MQKGGGVVLRSRWPSEIQNAHLSHGTGTPGAVHPPWPCQWASAGHTCGTHTRDVPRLADWALTEGTGGKCGGGGGGWGELGGGGRREASADEDGKCKNNWKSRSATQGNQRKMAQKWDEIPNSPILPEVEALPHTSLQKG